MLLCGVGLMDVSSPLTIAINALASPFSTHGRQVRSLAGRSVSVPESRLLRFPLVFCFSQWHTHTIRDRGKQIQETAGHANNFSIV